MTDELRLQIEGGVATLTMNRPDRRNAQDPRRDLSCRLGGQHRSASRRVRELLATEWEAAD